MAGKRANPASKRTNEQSLRSEAIRERLRRAIPAPQTELAFGDAWQLVVATILSAQATDKTINEITPVLFDRWPRPADLAAAELEEIESVIHRSGVFRRKAKLIQAAARVVSERFGGEVPRTMGEITEVPGVARKTGNVVLGSAYGLASGIVVDTHVTRVAGRLGLVDTEDANKVEQALCALWPPGDWVAMGHRLLLHGRYLCTARKPDCPQCPLNEVCPSRLAEAVAPWEDRAQAERDRIGRAAG